MKQGKLIKLTITKEYFDIMKIIINNLPQYHIGRDILEYCSEKYKESKNRFEIEEPNTEFGGITLKVYATKSVYEFFKNEYACHLQGEQKFIYQIINRYSEGENYE